MAWMPVTKWAIKLEFSTPELLKLMDVAAAGFAANKDPRGFMTSHWSSLGFFHMPQEFKACVAISLYASDNNKFPWFFF